MSEFRFRAQVALDLRKKQEDEAAAALALAEAAFQRVAAERAAAGVRREAAMAGRLADQRAGTDAGTLEWHWNWINGLAATVERLGRDLDVQRLAVGEAERAWRDARRRRLVLERLRDRMLRRHHDAQQRKDMNTVDELARLRFVLPDASLGRDTHDD
jgi:flagellar export protein FliJ